MEKKKACSSLSMNNENPETKMRFMNNGREGRKAKKKPLNQKDKLTRFKWPKDNDSKQSQRKRKKKKKEFLSCKERSFEERKL